MHERKRLHRVAVVVLASAIFGIVPATPASAIDAPSLLAPVTGETIGGNPTLQWQAVDGAVSYRVQISTSATFSTLDYNVLTKNVYATPPADLPLGTLYWRAAADGGSGLGPYASGSFEKVWAVAPALIGPSDGAVLDYPHDAPTFAWQPLQGAKSYRLEIDDADDFVGATAYTTSGTSFTVTEPQTVEPQVWYWRVRGVSSNANVNSQWSETRSYSIRWDDVPVLVTPANSTLTAIEDVNFRWDAVVGARTYQLQVSPNGDWTNNVVVNVTVKGTRYSPTQTINNGSYFWRVRALDAAGTPNAGPWSDVWQFTRGWPDVPSLVAPADGNFAVQQPAFEWTPVDHASHYELQVGTDLNFSPGTYSACTTNRTTWTPYRLVTPSSVPVTGTCSIGVPAHGTVYYWRVRGIDGPANVNGVWSDTWSFIYRPAIPTLTSPADGATVSAPVLTWDAVPDITQYKVTIRKASGTVAISEKTYATSYSPTKKLEIADGPFSWYVQVVDHAGNEGLTPAMEDWWHFSLEAPSPTYDFPHPLGPEAGAASARMPSLTWQPVTGAGKYSVFYGVAGSGVVHTLGTGIPFAAFTSTADVLPPGNYVWYVEAFTSAGALLAAGDWGAFTISDLAAVTYVSPSDCEPASPCQVIADTPTLQWQSVPSAGSYLVYVAADASFTNVVKTYETQFTQLSPRESFLDNQAGQAYYWFVRPCKTSTRCGPFNSTVFPSAYAFQKRSAAVQQVSPDDGAVIANQVTFSWEEYLSTNGALMPAVTQGAKQYKIQVSTVADFASVLDEKSVDQTTYTPFDKTYPEGPLYWRVQAIDGSNNALTWSTVRSITKQSPEVQLSTPADGASVTGVPALRWTPQAYAARYEVQVFKNADTTYSDVNRVLAQQTKMAAWAPTTALAAGTYAWRVRRIDADNRSGPWSESQTRRFTFSLGAPALLAPDDGSSVGGNALLFQWSAVTGAVKYRFEMSASSAFTSPSVQETVMTSWAPVTTVADGTWYWRVRVLDGSSNVLATSAARTFAKDSVRPSVTAKTPTTSAPITASFTVTFSEPVKNLSPSTFKMTIAGTTTSVAGTVTPSSSTATTQATFDPTPVLVPGQHYTLALTSGIVDAFGNALVPTSWTVRTSTIVENTSPAFVEAWDRDVSSLASGGGYDASDLAGSSTTFRFRGTNVVLVGRRAPDGGYAYVYLDGVKKATISSYASSVQWQRALWSATGLADTTHVLTVRVAGTRPSASKGTWVYVDAFKVGSTVYQENASTVSDRYRVVSTTSALGGSYDLARHNATGDTGSRPFARVTFKGPGFDLYATKTPRSGRVLVYIDGSHRATIDLYASSISYRQKVYASPTLTNAVHTVVLYLAGSKSAASTGYDVGLDQVRVR